MRAAGFRDPADRGLERRVLELQMDAEARAEVGVAVGDHVDALDGRGRLDVPRPSSYSIHAQTTMLALAHGAYSDS